MEYRFSPILVWPYPPRTRPRKRAPFRAVWSSTRAILQKELAHLQARNVVIQCDADASAFRLDGMLRADAKLRSPRIILSFDSTHGPLSYPCETFDQWQANVRAIALGLNALRMVDRYGVARRGEQYAGFKSLPGPPPAANNGRPMRPDEALNSLRSCVGSFSISYPDLGRAIRNAQRKTHPDAGGTAEAFKCVQAAAEALRSAGYDCR